MKLLPALAVALAAALPALSQAAAITTTYTHGAGNSWTAEFTVTNDGAPATLGGFTVYFDYGLFSGLSVTGSPAGWDSVVLQPGVGPGSELDGTFDSQLLDWSQALTAGASATGFALEFTYLGAGAPGVLPFEIYDQNYEVTFSGEASVNAAPAQVPEPATGLLVLAGLAALSGLRTAGAKRRRLHGECAA